MGRGYDIRLDKERKMAQAHVNSSDKESDSKLSLELEIGSDGIIRPFMFEPQHGTSSEEEADSYTTQDQSRNGGILRTIAFW